MLTGLFFGSFNPMHIGHLALANYLTEYTPIRQLWFVPSPLNPLKNIQELLPYDLRCELIEQAIRKDIRFQVLRIEELLPSPHYTIRTLRALSMLYPHHRFALLIGADNWQSFDQWKDHHRLMAKYELIIYPRFGYEVDDTTLPTGCRYIHDAPRIEISSTQIRTSILEGKDLRYWLPLPESQDVIASALQSCLSPKR